ncbi:hypothetical protein [Pseudomonas sp. G(2018)]|uniref:hypothetical protein n=1 Tax=Pseudomonas sp. G(2018) TaxID=2502242 RepID=UPI0021155B86|nr:hypothetical protein [Pseudomonas sp. G(2018)]
MSDQPLRYGTYQWFEETAEELPLNASEIEVRLAIAEFVLRRVAGTPAGEEIFNGLFKLFENRYPHHKLLSHYLLSPGYLPPDAEDLEPEAEENTLGFGGVDERLVNNLRHRDESQEPSGPLAGLGTDLPPGGTRRRKPNVRSPGSDKG